MSKPPRSRLLQAVSIRTPERHHTALECCFYVNHTVVRQQIKNFYRDRVREAMLSRVVMFGLDPIFQSLCRELADELLISVTEASELLWPTANEVYRGAHETVAW